MTHRAPAGINVGWGWAGSIGDFLRLSRDDLLASLSMHHLSFVGEGPSSSQLSAWEAEHRVMSATLSEVGRREGHWSVIFEYELPLEGGRRPDVVVLAGETVIVLEFKLGLLQPNRAGVDQVNAYARNLAEYHEQTHQMGLGRMERSVIPVLVLPSASGLLLDTDEALAVSPENLTTLLGQLATGGFVDLQAWLTSAYVPLPSLVRAAKAIFDHEDLPHVRAARSARSPETVELVTRLAAKARTDGRRHLILVGGVPGAGKTLVGLRAVYEHSSGRALATFLSGNGPLVTVLQDALKSTVFVKDLHAYIRTYGINARQPIEHVVVFDEAQRAWDHSYMLAKRNIPRSEPELLIAAAQRLPDWAAFIGLVGDGQEIHSGKEGGLVQWSEAIAGGGESHRWVVHAPLRLVPLFRGLQTEANELLDLTTSLRSRQAEDLHEWVGALLDGAIDRVADWAASIDPTEFVMYQSRDLDEIATYCRRRYEDQPDARFGLVSSSHAKNLSRYGVDNSWIVTSRMNLARWYNSPPDHPDSCCQLQKPVTEFGCQGLELDLPIVAWGTDMLWSGITWTMAPVRRRHALEDPEEILRNVYRVLLTRGRDGFAVFVPPTESLDATASVLREAGVRPLDEATRALSTAST